VSTNICPHRTVISFFFLSPIKTSLFAAGGKPNVQIHNFTPERFIFYASSESEVVGVVEPMVLRNGQGAVGLH